MVGDNSEMLTEPSCILMPQNLPVATGQKLSPEPFSRVSEIRVGVPDTDASAVVHGQPHVMVLIFDEARLGERCDLRPDLPLIVRW